MAQAAGGLVAMVGIGGGVGGLFMPRPLKLKITLIIESVVVTKFWNELEEPRPRPKSPGRIPSSSDRPSNSPAPPPKPVFELFCSSLLISTWFSISSLDMLFSARSSSKSMPTSVLKIVNTSSIV